MGQLLLTIFAPIILLIGGVFKAIYWLLFSWWLEPWQGRKADNSFAQEVRAKLSFLFREHSARIVPSQSQQERSMDAAWVTVEAENLRLHFLRGRGDLTVTIAPKQDPSDWHDLSLVTMVLETPEGIGPRERVGWLEDVAKLLHAHWNALNQALSLEEYPRIRKRLNAIYDLPGDDLWRLGINIPRHLRTGSRSPLPLAKYR